MKQNIALRDKELRTQINLKFNDISSTDENKWKKKYPKS
jgi:hypothetical protein